MTKRYKVQEIYYTLQGEGFYTARPAIFCRFVGCNLWSGKEKDRPKASCRFCDTNFLGMTGPNGGTYTAKDLIQKIQTLWTFSKSPFVVFTGGEPLLQLDLPLVEACKKQNFFVAVETNGTKEIPDGIDWICISPKPRSQIVVPKASELKLVFPQPEEEMHPRFFENFDAEHHYLQPLDNEQLHANTELASNFCKENPKWKLSIQTHKFLQLP